MDTYSKKQTNWEGLWHRNGVSGFCSRVIDASELKKFNGSVRIYVRKNKYYNNGKNGRPNYVFCIAEANNESDDSNSKYLDSDSPIDDNE